VYGTTLGDFFCPATTAHLLTSSSANLPLLPLPATPPSPFPLEHPHPLVHRGRNFTPVSRARSRSPDPRSPPRYWQTAQQARSGKQKEVSLPPTLSLRMGKTYGYQYNTVGNRTVYTLTTPLDGTTVTTYTYDAANRLLVAGAPGHSVAYTWNARGNLPVTTIICSLLVTIIAADQPLAAHTVRRVLSLELGWAVCPLLLAVLLVFAQECSATTHTLRRGRYRLQHCVHIATFGNSVGRFSVGCRLPGSYRDQHVPCWTLSTSWRSLYACKQPDD